MKNNSGQTLVELLFSPDHAHGGRGGVDPSRRMEPGQMRLPGVPKN